MLSITEAISKRDNFKVSQSIINGLTAIAKIITNKSLSHHWSKRCTSLKDFIPEQLLILLSKKLTQRYKDNQPDAFF